MSSLNFVKENYPQVLNEIKAELNKGDKIKYAEIVEWKINKIKDMAAKYNAEKANIKTPAQYDEWVVKMNKLDEIFKKLIKVVK